MLSCPNCGSNVKETDTFCEGCGMKLAGQGQPQRQPTQDPPLPQQTPPGIICDKCGQEIKDISSRFCQACGNELRTNRPHPQTPDVNAQNEIERGCLVFPDMSEIQITPVKRLIGRVDFAAHVSKQDISAISRAHLTVYQNGEEYYIADDRTTIQDKPSLNKTWIVRNGVRELITGRGPYKLNNGDLISIADVVKLTFAIK